MLAFLESLVDKSAVGLELVKPQGVSMGTTTTIFTFSMFTFTKDVNITGEHSEESKAIASSGPPAQKTAQEQTTEDVNDHLRSSEVFTVSHLEIY